LLDRTERVIKGLVDLVEDEDRGSCLHRAFDDVRRLYLDTGASVTAPGLNPPGAPEPAGAPGATPSG
jgi:hypothetical protein